MNSEEFASRLAVALVCGLVIGFERQFRQKDAGLRTNALVALGAAAYVLLSLRLTDVDGDVTRIIGQVVTGVGFLGGGVIFKSGLNVHGLSSAGTIWCSSAIGCIAAAGMFEEALICTAGVLFTNVILLPVDRWMRNRKTED
jgi:putative Mg2+ transporter-C (MgtC) family protein